MTRAIYDIAREIRNDWKVVNFAAVPYLDAMSTIGHVNDAYGADTGQSVVMYFLSNAASWRGDTARRIKAELKSMI